ncbi:MAG: TonB-dependent receptor [Bacteroidetes bacterium]|nr:TonB-dependent receptor [Bacteroidota bacterium]
MDRYYRSLFIAALLCMLPMLLMAAPENILKGTVTDVNKAPLIGATVAIPDLKLGTVTDEKGNYSLSALPKGRFLVQVKMLGFETITRTVDISNQVEQNFTLKESIIEKNEVVVTGTSMATEQRRSVTPIQMVRMQELRQNAFTNVVDAIAKLPGISQVSTGPAISKPVIRGLGYNRVITLNDGVRQEGQQWGDEHGIEIDDYNVSRIEVLKGPASLAYGSDALAGVINIVSDEPLPQGKIQGNVIANYQTNSGLGALHGDLGGNINGISWNAYATGKQSHDYHNAYDGYVFDTRFHNLNYGATIGINKKWGYSRLSYTSFGQTLGLAEGERDSATGKFIKTVNNGGVAEEQLVTDEDGKSYARVLPSQRIDHHKLVLNNNFYLNNGSRIGVILGYQQNSRKEFGDVLNPDEPGLHFQLRTYTYDVKYFYPVWNGWQVTTGVNGMAQNNANKGIEFLIPDYNLFDVGLYTIAKKEWKQWAISGGLRYNYRTLTVKSLYLDSTDKKVEQLMPGGFEQFTPFTRNFSNLVGSIGTSYAASKQVTFKFNIATGFRSPNAAELAANGVHEGTIRYEYGTPGLKAENSMQGDLGMAWNANHIELNASVFYNYISNYIYLEKLLGANGSDSIPAEHNDQAFGAYAYAQSNAGLYGGELYIDLHPHPLDWLHLANTFSYVRGMIFNGTDSTRNLPSMPPARWLIELRAEKRSLGKWIKNGYVKVSTNIVFAQNDIFSAYGTETATPGYTLFNAGLGLDLVNKAQKTVCTLSLSTQNITDVAYQDHLNRLKYADVNYATGRTGIYNMGRNFSIMASIPLRFK